MKSFLTLFLVLQLAACPLASARDWQPARVVDSSETDISSQMRASKNVVHYTVETSDAVYFLDYTYKPGPQTSGAPNIAVNVLTKMAVEGKHAYLLDVNGKELKLHVVKKKPKS